MNQMLIDVQGSGQNLVEIKPGRLFPPGHQFAPRSTAVLHRCQDCRVWWGSSQQYSLYDFQVFRAAEPNSEQLLWEDYRGWFRSDEAGTCPECDGKETAVIPH